MTTAKELPSLEYLRECFYYDNQAEKLCWNTRPDHHFKSSRWASKWNKDWSGKVVGSRTTKGYKRVSINKESFPIHRIIFKIVTGLEPQGIIDHIDGDIHNNSFSNLRECTSSENNFNRKMRIDNKSGYKGVYFSKRGGYFIAQIKFGGKICSTTGFSTAEEAFEYRSNLLEYLHKDFSNFG